MVPTVSIIVCSYTEQRWNQLQNCIESARNQTLPAREIILVIDHNDTLLARAQTVFAGVLVLPNRSQQGLSGARNTGIASATGDIIAFVDDDGIIAPDWLERLCDCLEDPAVMGSGGTITPMWEGKPPRWFPPEFFWVIGCTYEGQPRKRQVVRNLWGSMCVRRTVFEAVGGFRSNLGRVGAKPLGDEETELCIRASLHWPKSRWIFEPMAVMHHSVPATRSRWNYFRSRCYHEGISKSAISRLVGRNHGLSAERGYVLRVLPGAVMRGLFAPLQGDLSGLQRAGAVVIGLLLTSLGYVVGTFASKQTLSAMENDRVADVSLLKQSTQTDVSD
jgi:glycosyltransferase involved in cell wall biosynthesis